MTSLNGILTNLRKKNLPRLLTFFLFAIAAVITCSPDRYAQISATSNLPLEWPELQDNYKLVKHKGFTLAFDTIHRQARWVAYVLRAERTSEKEPRTNRFYPDPNLPGRTATDADYRKSGYDRGHLAPAADMNWSAETLKESFYYSNVSPQKPEFNRGIWKKLESRVRTWAQQDSVLYVVTGPVLHDSLPRMGSSKVSVPAYFYKSIMVYKPGIKKAIAFIMRNEGSAQNIEAFAVSVDSLEQFTGLNFFSALPDKEEEQIEKSVCLPCWNLKRLD